MLRCTILAALVVAASGEDRVLGTVFDGAAASLSAPVAAIDLWSWTPAQRTKALQWSQSAVVEVDGVRCLRLAIGPGLPWTRPSYDLAGTMGPDYLEPSCDAVRLRCRVAEGSFRLALGGPTSYFANSDVFTAPVQLEPSADWREVVIPLDVGLSRNFRRAGFGATNPVVAYARWIQEGMRIAALSGSRGVLLLQRIELLAQGRGRPYPQPPAGGLPAAGPAIAPAAADLFTAFIQRDLAFAAQPQLPNRSWRPPVAAIAAADGRSAWTVRMRGAEEVAFAGCRLRVPAGARALSCAVATGRLARTPLCLEFLILAAEGDVPWDALAPPPAWRAEPATAFDAFLTATTTASASLALYHVRRAVPADSTAALLIPWEDAVCVWASGACAADFAQQRVLQPERIRALLVAPSFRHAAAESAFSISGLQPVALPADWTQLRSFHQPDPAMLSQVRDSAGWLHQTARTAP